MNYTVTVNEAKKEIKVTLDGYEGIARCCPTDNFNLGTGIELALERAKVAKAEANKPKPAAKPTVAEARAILEEYVGDHTAIIGKGKTLSDRQKKELWDWAMTLAPEYAPSRSCECEDRYEEGYADGYDEGVRDTLADLEDEDYDECEDEEDECECQCNGKCQCEGAVTGAMIKALIEMAMKG
jgi:hypothetical protein